MYQVTRGDGAGPPSDLGLVTLDSRLRTGHEHCYEEKKARTDRLKFSMVHRTIPQWNRLPATLKVAEAGSLDICKSQLSALYP